MITRDEILMGREKQYPLTKLTALNLDRLHYILSAIRFEFGKPMKISSGYRPGHFNKAAGGATNSQHLICAAVDFSDPNGEIYDFMNERLEKYDLYMEDRKDTPTWCHLQLYAPRSGNRVFRA